MAMPTDPHPNSPWGKDDLPEQRPMIFATDKAFERLRDKGEVLTARTNEKGDRAVWIRRSRTGEKEFDAYRMHVTTIAPRSERDKTARERVTDFAIKYHERGGFGSGKEWVDALRDHHGEVPQRLYIYEVLKVGGGD